MATFMMTQKTLETKNTLLIGDSNAKVSEKNIGESYVGKSGIVKMNKM